MDTLHVQFHGIHNGAYPYMLTVYSYTEEDGEFCIEFDGYLYATEDQFPVRCIASIIQEDSKESPKSMHAIVRIDRRETVQNTSVYSEMDDFGESMKVCFFPTHRQKIWFRILEDL
jgi:hypothetical protein